MKAIHIHQTGGLSGPHHLRFGQVLRSLRAQRPQYGIRMQPRHERRQAAQIVAVAEQGKDHVRGSIAPRPHRRARIVQLLHEHGIVFHAENDDVGAALDAELFNPAPRADELFPLPAFLHRETTFACRFLRKPSIVA